MTLVNLAKETMWVALSSNNSGGPKSNLTDSVGVDVPGEYFGVSGWTVTASQNGDIFYKPTEIGPGESIPATIKFISPYRTAIPGECKLQVELLVGNDVNSGVGHCKPHSLSTRLTAE